MKGKNNLSKKFNGQIQTMGKGGIKDISNSNYIQPNMYNNNNFNYNNQMYNYPMNQNQMYQMPMMPNQMPLSPNKFPNQYNGQMNMYNNNYPIQNMNNYNNMHQNSGIKVQNKNNPIVRNAKMIMDNNINNKKKASSAKRTMKKNQSNEVIHKNNRDGNIPSYNNMGNNNNYNMYNNMVINGNNNLPMMNNPQPVYNQYSPQRNSNNIQNLNKKIKKVNDYQYMEFHPYTLKDYKELMRNPVVMGPLGANIGTKEWESKKNKMKKMMNYSNNINKEHKGIKTLKKDTPKDEIEKMTKEKIEKSIRHRTYEYGKLVRAQKYREEETDENLVKNNNISDNLDVIPEKADDLGIRRYEDQFKQEEINHDLQKSNTNEENSINNMLDIEQLLKQKEAYKEKIQGIRDTLLD